ncbi:MAG: DUF3826 domain-containing protein [Marinilabiliaceae bacterium]|nr:DUF3826 domain-containing protein [Marinilabiliaceae bacterium]
MKRATIFALMLFVGSIAFLTQTSFNKDQVQEKQINEQEKKATEWVQSLNLSDKEKEQRIIKVVTNHLTAVRNWHNEHPATTVPEGINPRTGEKLTELDRQIIADSAMPNEVHENLMSGLRADLLEEQVEAILDKYTVGKVAFTMKGYQAIVPDLTDEESATILSYLKEAREMAVDYKSMKQISAIFEIYKTKCEQYLNGNGRSWRDLYRAYVKKVKEEKSKKESGAKK